MLYDIGAIVGAYSLVVALSPAVRAHVVAVEPGFPTFAALSDNVERGAGPGDCASGGPGALDDPLRPCTCARSTWEAALHALGGHDGPTGAAYHQPVLTFRLDDLVERFGLPSPALVII